MRHRILRTQAGATLIEVLIAMVVLAVALLGMAGLTSASIKYNQFSRIQATGLSLVNDYAERARANLAGFATYENKVAYNASTRATAATDPSGSVETCEVTAAPTNTCGAAVATYDKTQWLLNVTNRLPGGTAYVEAELPAVPAATGMPPTRVLNIWLIWTAIEESTGFGRGKQDCPTSSTANIDEDAPVNCMFFRVTL